MKQVLNNNSRRTFVVCAIIVTVFLSNVFFRANKAFIRTTAQNLVTLKEGDSKCATCHKEICEAFGNTAHFHTSAHASKQTVKGSFETGKNTYTYNKFMYVEMQQVEDSLFQTAMINGLPFETESFDVVIGSGRKGQTYLYWNNAKLFQLPVSFYSAANAWCNSPGYPSTLSSFDRQVNAQCLECHGTYAKAQTTLTDGSVFDSSTIIYGIRCERCHGNAEQHARYFAMHPSDTGAKYIISATQLTRQQNLDACALCHSGLRKETRPAFSFQVGDKLDDYSAPGYNTDSAAMLDVHGNQYGLLTASKCFRFSQMDCASCHNVHANEAFNTKVFSQRCMTCHNNTSHDTCTMKDRGNLVLSNNCIDCHMPLLPSQKIFLQLVDRDKSTPDFVRTHRIAIYPRESKDFVKRMKKTI